MRGVSNDIILLLIITQLWRIKVRIDKVKANQKKKKTQHPNECIRRSLPSMNSAATDSTFICSVKDWCA